MALKNNFEELKKLSDGYYYRCEGKETVQKMGVADLEREEDIELVKKLLPQEVQIVYSDPPWDPGNRKYWRTHADKSHEGTYDEFLEKWTNLVDFCIEEKNTQHIFTEQSYNDENRDLFLNHTEKWKLEKIDQFKVYYGSPGSRSRQHPNILLHFADEPISTDPSGLDGEPMTIRACAGVDIPPSSTVFDPCIGKGMTSRMALYFQWNCIGTEINPKRLGKAITWLERHDFEVKEVKIDERESRKIQQQDRGNRQTTLTSMSES